MSVPQKDARDHSKTFMNNTSIWEMLDGCNSFRQRQDVWESAKGLRDKNPIGFGSKTNKNIRTGAYLVCTENQQKRRNGNGVALNTEPIQNMLSVDAQAGTRRWAHRRAHQQSETGRHHNRDVVSECKMVMSSRDVDL